MNGTSADPTSAALKADPSSASPASVPAIVTFLLIGIWAAMVAGLFVLIANKIELTAIQVGLLSGTFGTETTLLVASVSFWVGSTAGGKAMGDQIARSGAQAQATVASIAASGPPPPPPGSTTTTTTVAAPAEPAAPTPVVVTNDTTDPVPVQPGGPPADFMNGPVR